MKIYLFDVETGLYLGQDYADTSSVAGICDLPENATAIRPPEYGSDRVPVMNRQTMQWELRLKDH